MPLTPYPWFPGGLKTNPPVFWFMMRIGMLIGFATTYPVNWQLVRTGAKERM